MRCAESIPVSGTRGNVVGNVAERKRVFKLATTGDLAHQAELLGCRALGFSVHEHGRRTWRYVWVTKTDDIFEEVPWPGNGK